MNFGSVPFVAAATPDVGGLLTASDDFNRADGALGSNWAVLLGTASISSNEIALGVADTLVRWQGSTFGADQQADFVIGAPGSSHCGGGVRIQPSTGHGYYCSNETSSTQVDVRRYNGGGSFTSLGSVTGLSLVSGDRIGLRAVGSSINFVLNGVVTGSTFTDSTHATGQPGGYGFLGSSTAWQATEI